MKKTFLILIFLLLNLGILLAQGTGVYCLQFDGNDNSVEVPDSNTLDNTNKMTIEFWVYPTTLDGEARGVLSKRVNYDDNNSYGVFFYTNDHLYIDLDGTNDRFASSKTFTTNKWYYVAIVYDGTLAQSQRVKLYIAEKSDAAITLDSTVAETSTTLPNTASNLYFGQLHGTTPSYGCYAGSIDEIRIWNIARTQTELDNNFKKQIDESTSGLVGYWRFNENTGQTAGDETSNNNDGTLGTTSSADTNDPTWVDSDAPLPVVLSEFTAMFANGLARLSWITLSESNNSYWNIYRAPSQNFGQATKINENPISANGTTSEASHYIFTDNNSDFIEGQTYSYWIESVDYTGASSLYSPINLTIPNQNNPEPPQTLKEYTLSQNYPNPFNPTTEIKFELDKNSNAKLEIYNSKGQKVKTLFNGYARANQAITRVWNATSSPSGIYFYKLTVKGKVITKKMILMK